MSRKLITALTAALALAVNAYSQIVIDPSVEIGQIKPMNAVNNGPKVAPASQKKGNFESYKAAGFPYARLHDAPLYAPWAHCVDIDCVFPDFSADESNAESYDFKLTDKLLKEIYQTGTKVFYRLGQSIENAAKKYEVYPPADYGKWARVCEHIIMHYNEGWADGFHYGIEYWEIWNEPDLGFRSGRHLKNDSPTWNGSDKDYFRFFATVSKHLKNRFPDLKFGGPALCEDNEWAERFLVYSAKHGVKMDFFSYHLYAGTPEAFVQKNALMKSLLDRYGYSDVEMILNEWNYLSNWTDEYVYTAEVIKSSDGAAFTAAVMQACQNGPTDMLMYYDARPNTTFNGLFDFTTFATLPPYYAFYSWKKLRELGTQVFSSVESAPDIHVTAAKNSDIRVTAAKSPDGRMAILISHFSNDRNRIAPIPLSIQFKNCNIHELRSFVTDKYKLHTETPVELTGNTATIVMSPNSFLLLEIR